MEAKRLALESHDWLRSEVREVMQGRRRGQGERGQGPVQCERGQGLGKREQRKAEHWGGIWSQREPPLEVTQAGGER